MTATRAFWSPSKGVAFAILTLVHLVAPANAQVVVHVARPDVESYESMQFICEAIDDRRVIELRYRNGGWRTLEPRLLGETRRGNLLLHGWQTAGDSESGGLPGFRSFSLGLISEFRVMFRLSGRSGQQDRWPQGVVADVCDGMR